MLGAVLGPLLGGVIIDHLGWRWMSFVDVPFYLTVIAAALWMLPRGTGRDAAARFDAVGTLLLPPGLATVVYGLSGGG